MNKHEQLKQSLRDNTIKMLRAKTSGNKQLERDLFLIGLGLTRALRIIEE
jgi:hypothetical protein